MKKTLHEDALFDAVIDELCEPGSYEAVYHRTRHTEPMPSIEVLTEVVERLRAILFPGFFGKSDIQPETMRYHVGSNLDTVFHLLTEQIERGLCFVCTLGERGDCSECKEKARNLAEKFVTELPAIRKLLATDVKAAYVGDPAAKSEDETIFCYPSIVALTNHRIAHELHKLGVAIIPRIIGEMAHSKTGIDINPGATIGKGCFIDHGTGTVIGETCIIGNNVRIYQGVTLGAKSFPKAQDGTLIKELPRHPIVEDDVIIYSGATILGRVTIGKGAVIGGNVWLTHDVAPNARVVQHKTQISVYENGGGI